MLAGYYRCFFFLLVLLGASSLSAQQPKAENLIDLEIFADSSAVSPLSELWVGLRISLSPHWHIYWKNAGGSGYPTTVRWKLPDGWHADPLEFPPPYLYEYEGMSGYALENNFTLLARLVAPTGIENKIELHGSFEALICNESTCLPYEFPFSVTVKGADRTQLIPRNASLIKKARSRLPQNMPEGVTTRVTSNEKSGRLLLQTPHFSSIAGSQFSFFPDSPSILPDPQSFSFLPQTGTLEIGWDYSEEEGGMPGSIDGVLIHPEMTDSWKLSVPLQVNEMNAGRSFLPPQELLPGNDDRLLHILLGLVLISLAAWAYGRSRQPLASVRGWQVLCLTSLLSGVWMAYPTAPSSSAGSLGWQPWSQPLQDDLLAKGEAVYIDYTAKWCLSCQVNKRVYNDGEVRDALVEQNVHLLRADWTKKSADILKSLQSYGREGVPFNVYYPAAQVGKNTEPIHLPEILSANQLVRVITEEQMMDGPSGEENHFIALLGLAWLGGLILNLMPCVFPVIGLKIMGFVKQAGEDRSLISRHGWVFTLGVVLSFWVLVGVLLVLRDGLEQNLGWGFQLQEPAFVLVLAILLFLFGLSLSGVFEIGLSMTGLGAEFSRKPGLSGSFFSGVLATVVATPCMAPFLGVAVGAALTMPALPSFAIFTAIALGLSTPYLLLASFPAWLERLPKPGMWMESFKQFMAFPVYATVAWLIWTLDGLL